MKTSRALATNNTAFAAEAGEKRGRDAEATREGAVIGVLIPVRRSAFAARSPPFITESIHWKLGGQNSGHLAVC